MDSSVQDDVQRDPDAPRPGAATWWEAARPRTLPASVAPVLVGTAAANRVVAWGDGVPGVTVFWGRFVLALLVALLLQVAVNFANDYFDGVGGVDTEDRVGPRRMVASGLVQPDQMKAAMLVALGAAGVIGLVLALLAGWQLLLIGVAALLATVGYSGGPRPYASAGLGEVMVFVFFGLVATMGSAYVQDERVLLLHLLVALPMGLLSTALLVVNNLRDIPTDRVAGKVTLAVRLGDAGTRRLYVGLVVGAYVALLPMVLQTSEGMLLLAGLSLPVAWRGVEVVRRGATGPALIAALEATARTQAVYTVLLVVGLLLRDLELL